MKVYVLNIYNNGAHYPNNLVPMIDARPEKLD